MQLMNVGLFFRSVAFRSVAMTVLLLFAKEGAAQSIDTEAPSVQVLSIDNTAPRPKRDPYRFDAVKVFAMGCAAQAFGVVIGILPLMVTQERMTDRTATISYGAGLGAATFFGVFGAHMITDKRLNLPSLIVSNLVGNSLAFLNLFFFRRADNPEVDGKYDSIYFQRKKAPAAIWGTFSLALFPMFLAPLSMMGATMMMKEKKQKQAARRVTILPPSLTVWQGATGRREPAVQAGILF